MSSATQKAYLPDNWSDDLRMSVMFSDFRNRNVNPADWDGKLMFWRSAIRDWCAASERTEFNTADIRNAFVRNGRTPRCLATVTSEMMKQGQLMTLEAFQKHTAEQGWVGWSWDVLVQRPLGYTWSLIGSSLFAPKETSPVQQFVNFDLIREKSDLILRRHLAAVEAGQADSTVSWDALAKLYQDVCKTSRDLELCLMLLKKEKHLTLHVEQDQKIVKFAVTGKPASTTTKLSQVEKSMVQLRMVQKTLEQQIDLHESEVEKYTNEARAQLALNNRKMAKAALYKRRQSGTLITKKEKTLENIELLLNNLQDVDTQKAVLNALQAGSNAYKLTQMSEGFDLDTVDETMANVQETLEMQHEMENVLGQPLRQDDHDTAELEQELEDILGDGDGGNDSDYEEPAVHTQETISPTAALAQRLKKLREPEEATFPDAPTHSPTADTRGRVRLH